MYHQLEKTRFCVQRWLPKFKEEHSLITERALSKTNTCSLRNFSYLLGWYQKLNQHLGVSGSGYVLALAWSRFDIAVCVCVCVCVCVTMKFSIEKIVQGSCRLGVLREVGKQTNLTVETPFCLLYTRAGEVILIGSTTTFLLSAWSRWEHQQIPVCCALTTSAVDMLWGLKLNIANCQPECDCARFLIKFKTWQWHDFKSSNCMLRCQMSTNLQCMEK